jgi:hypothetical protein
MNRRPSHSLRQQRFPRSSNLYLAVEARRPEAVLPAGNVPVNEPDKVPSDKLNQLFLWSARIAHDAFVAFDFCSGEPGKFL